MAESVAVYELYRQIGDFFRVHGAERVILRSAKLCSDGVRDIELVADRFCGDSMEEELKQKWPLCRIRVRLLETEEWNAADAAELDEDGIRI